MLMYKHKKNWSRTPVPQDDRNSLSIMGDRHKGSIVLKLL